MMLVVTANVASAVGTGVVDIGVGLGVRNQLWCYCRDRRPMLLSVPVL